MSSLAADAPGAAEGRLAELESALAAERAINARLSAERDSYRAACERLKQELQLLKRRLFVAKAERVNVSQLELEFAQKKAELERLMGNTPGTEDQEAVGIRASSEAPADPPAGGDGDRENPTRNAGGGRRKLAELDLPEERVEIIDELLEKLVAEGKAERMGFEESSQIGWKRGGQVRIVLARAKYRVTAKDGTAALETTPLPPKTLRRSLFAPSMMAHIIVDKYCDGLPLYRIEQRMARDGIAIDRGTLSRLCEDVGAALGATIVAACKADAWNAFCIATDATGVSVQPMPDETKGRQPCRKGHFFVMVADRDHVIFEYTPKHTSDFVKGMLKGYEGFVQADANSVYDALFRPPGPKDSLEEQERSRPSEVGCWVHCRRGFWETATTTKDPIAREGLLWIRKMFELDETWRKKPPRDVQRLREQYLRPLMEAFFAWAQGHYEAVRDQRGPLRAALGYAVRQREPLLRVLADGRLPLDNNRSESALRPIASGRKAWLFCGSDDHATSAANLFTLIASARLHRLHPEQYLTEIIRVLPHWPRDRHLELSPKYWAQTRARLDPVELAAEIGPLTVPPPLTLLVPSEPTSL